MFLVTAAFFGFLVGGMAGLFSEFIAGAFVSSKGDELTNVEKGNDRRAEKVKRRVQALENYRAQNGGRMPEEFYGRFANAQNRQRMNQQRGSGMMEGYGTNPYNNRGYEGAEN